MAESESAKIETVKGDDITIRFDSSRCVHARQCVLTLPKVYRANVEGPWIHPDEASAEANAALAHNCPSGAIDYERHDGKPGEQAPDVNLVTIRENGPYAIRAPMKLNGGFIGYRATLCRCGASRNKPYCDGSHAPAGFTASGEREAEQFTPLTVRSGDVSIEPQPNGPLAIRGNIEVVTGTGKTVSAKRALWLCRCGQSANKPFCDGTHTKAGFQAA